MTPIIDSYETLEKIMHLSQEEIAYRKHPGADTNLPLKINSYYMSLIENRRQDGARFDPIRIQSVPRVQELNTMDYETRDPLGEGYHTPVSRVIHQYPDRVLIKVTDQCAVYCRHCFRRSFSGGTAGDISDAEIEGAAVYLKGEPGINEILLSGGDSLALPDGRLLGLIDALTAGQRERTFRICTRMPVVAPSRITPGLVRRLAVRKPVWVVTQYNHPRELTSESLEAVKRFLNAGIPVANQTVLLRGVNDDEETLVRLFTGLVAAGVKPYYLFQGDLAAGTSHLRVGLIRGLALVKALGRRVSGLAMPVYAVDLPEGGGKTVLSEKEYLRDEPSDILGPEGKPLAGWRIFNGANGREYAYPLEDC